MCQCNPMIKTFHCGRGDCKWPVDTAVIPPDAMMQFFAYAHLPVHLQALSRPFCGMAAGIITTLPRNPERTACLRKLLEAKDCAVRARLYVAEPVSTGAQS